MSRGPGKRQTLILETLEKYPEGFYLASLTADNVTENKSFNRAAYKLQEAGKLRVDKYNMGMKHVHCHDKDRGHADTNYLGGPKLVVRLPDAGGDEISREEL